MDLHDIGVIGLGVMGENLARNTASHGFSTLVHDLDPDRVDSAVAVTEGPRLAGAKTLAEFVAGLERPRRVVLLIPAGAPVDDAIAALTPLLDADDMIVDGGNSHPDDTTRRHEAIASKGLHFVGMGISGGEDGARNGPSLMPGGSVESYAALAPILKRIAAQVADGPCVTHIGPDASGHFVKTVHNGIEYADMQLIAETYDVLRGVGGMRPTEIGEVFANWNTGPMSSYLTEITSQILATVDPETGMPLIDRIVDRAGQKGTGRWTCELALRHGVPIPTIQAAVAARGLSALKDERIAASAVLSGPRATRPDRERLLNCCHDALIASKIVSYAQGLALIRTVSDEREWSVHLGEVARIWKGGCIIRARLLERIQEAYADDSTSSAEESALRNLMLDPSLREAIHRAQRDWRDLVAVATAHGVPVLAIASSLAYYDSYRRTTLPQNLTQAQRDLFGAHKFERTDRPAGELFHFDWNR